MKRFALRFILLAAASMLLPLAAHAQLFRAYLASYGNDSNPCVVSAPCRLLPAALNAVHDAGEIWMLDSANFNAGTVNITKDVSILAVPGQVGSIVSVANTPAISINSGVNVSLRNLRVVNNANNPGSDGIVLTASATLTVEDLVIAVNGTGINITAGGTVAVNNTSFRDSYQGIHSAGNAYVEVSHSTFANISSYAVLSDGSIAGSVSRVGVTDVVISNAYIGLFCLVQSATGFARAIATRTSFSGVGIGVASEVDAAGGGSDCAAGNSMFVNVSVPFYQFGAGAVVGTQGNNLARGVGSNSGSVTSVGSI